MSYLRFSRAALVACLLIWGAAMIIGMLDGAGEVAYLAGIVSSVLLGPLAANALIAQLIVRSRSLKVAKNG